LNPYLSLIIPARNEERRLPQSLEQVFAFLDRQSYTSEVVVVVNASFDRTLEIAREFAQEHDNLHIVHKLEGGKGRAVRAGMLEAHGEYRIFCDSDFSMPVEQVAKLLPLPPDRADIVIASREAPGAVRYNEPTYRHFTGRVFNTIIRLMVLPDLQDTQCGFKCFRAEIAEELFELQTIEEWAFDVELLFIAKRKGYTVREVAVDWYFNPESKVKIIRDSWRMFWDLIRIRRNAWRGLYDRQP
jgi:glycosyltransferase involved in cell wall biosynthesis